MKTAFFILVLNTIAINRIFCQFDFKPDSAFEYYESRIGNRFNIKAFDEKSYIFELRFWMDKMSGEKEFLFRLTYSKDSIWNAEKYDRKRTVSWYKTEKSYIKLSENWPQVWDSLINLKILEMPDIHTILKRIIKERPKKGAMMVEFGDYYKIELLTSKNKRSFWFDNPKDYADFYSGDYELENLINILRILYREFEYEKK